METSQLLALLWQGLKESLWMVSWSWLFAHLLGFPLGILLYNCSPAGLSPKPFLYKLISAVVNILRSVPFLILMVFVIPLTRTLVGTSLGSNAAIVPLVISSAPFVARLVESSLREVPSGISEAAISMGAGKGNILFTVLPSEARTSLASGSIITAVNILSYSSMAGFVGGGGLGAIAINYGYNRYNQEVMFWTVVVIVALVHVVEGLGHHYLKKLDARTGNTSQA